MSLIDITANPEKYGLHSLRAGGASAAASNGVFRKVRNGYIKDTVGTRLNVSKMLGL